MKRRKKRDRGKIKAGKKQDKYEMRTRIRTTKKDEEREE